MDTENLIAHARARFDHATAKRVIREKYEARMIFAHAGGMWRAGPELINILAAVPLGNAVLLDLYETPVQVRPEELRGLAMQRWQEQMNAWLAEHNKLSKKR
jgi:hypothetical protein